MNKTCFPAPFIYFKSNYKKDPIRTLKGCIEFVRGRFVWSKILHFIPLFNRLLLAMNCKFWDLYLFFDYFIENNTNPRVGENSDGEKIKEEDKR